MHIYCSRGTTNYTIYIEESDSSDLNIGSKLFRISISGDDPELDKTKELIRLALSSASGEASDIKQKIATAGFKISNITSKYLGTCQELIEQVRETVDKTIDTMDYDGLKPYVKLIKELNAGKGLEDIDLSSEGPDRGAICVGMSLAILRNLYHDHHILGFFAGGKDLGHAAVIIECQDGYVLIDNRSNPNNRLFWAPFNTSLECSFEEITPDGSTIHPTFFLTAGPPGASVPLTQTYGDGIPHEFSTDTPNIDDLITKHYIQFGISEFIPVAVYKKDGRPLKDIKVSPSRNMVILKDHVTGFKKVFSFEEIQRGDLSVDELKEFMGKGVFHSKRRTVHEEIFLVVSGIERIKKVFAEFHPKS
jgi:hypothetical protein